MAEETLDLLGAVDLAAELEDLATRVRSGTTIALFGSWGIGKTRIGELLKRRLEDEPLASRLPYIRFDASIGLAQELPERFVLECAKELDADVGALKEQLLAERKITKWALRVWHAGLPLLIAGGLASMLVVGLLLALVVAFVSDATFGEVVNDYVLVAVVAPAVVGALIGVAAKSLSEELTLKPAAIDFTAAYVQLLVDGGKQKVVVFVDELDRCPPDKLVDSLRALESFFSSKRTVFVVAVDRQAVERALTTSLGEHAPESVANDYYTAGSAYLDKLFKHQLTIPPLRSHAPL